MPWLAEHEPSIHALLLHGWWLPVEVIWICTPWSWMSGSGWGCCTAQQHLQSLRACSCPCPSSMSRLDVSKNLSGDKPGQPSQTELRDIPCCTTSWSAIKWFLRKQTLLRGWLDLLVYFWEVVSDGLHITSLGFSLPLCLLNCSSQQKLSHCVGKCGA